MLKLLPDLTGLCDKMGRRERFDFQDDFGQLMLECCQTIPFGILVFCTSYAMVDKLSKRWQGTAAWKNISALKRIVVEPRGGDSGAFEACMNEYYSAVKSAGEGNRGGALFLAVARGKVSEVRSLCLTP